MESIGEGVAGLAFARDEADLLGQALVDGIVEGQAVVAKAHRIALFLNGARDFIEDAVTPSMGRDDGELAAPGGAWFGHPEEFALVFVYGELVQFDVTGLSDE